MAYLALGRLGAPGASKVLIQRVKMGRPARETEGILLALGLTRDHVVLPHLERMSKQRKDGLRRAAVIALGYLEQDLVAPLLIVRADQRKEEDKMVRILALTGLARMQPDPELFLELMRRRPDAISDADEEAAWVLGLAALGGTDALREVAQYAKKNHREQVRCAAMAATIVIGGKDARALAQRLMNDDKDVVQRAALLAMIVHSRVNSDPMLVEAFVNNTDEQIRRTAVCGLVYLRGAAARAQLVRYLDNKYKDDVRELAKALIVELDRDERAARMINRARLQVLLDQNGWAPSWNLNRAANALIYRILNLENALSRRGAGQAPGASGGGPDRGRAAAATAPSPEEEDLRHHLDRHPYIDQRDHIEFPPVW
ncbi:MAG: hypothetical protein CMJ83_17465 [Planctomycetes bacterium]|nr:hypothetical protein [Planctomycetota bacterium]